MNCPYGDTPIRLQLTAGSFLYLFFNSLLPLLMINPEHKTVKLPRQQIPGSVELWHYADMRENSR
jgi:hypothetical protein